MEESNDEESNDEESNEKLELVGLKIQLLD